MKNFELIDPKIEAVRFFSENPPDCVSKVTPYSSVNDFGDYLEGFFVELKERAIILLVSEGNWLVFHPFSGVWSVIEDAYFTKNYRECENQAEGLV